MNNILNCIIVDDEEGAHLVLTHYIKELRQLELRASFFNAVEALEYLHHNAVDLMFLDINMPGMNGLQMLRALSAPPLVILTTAYREHALESYEYRVVDYLVKPVDLPRFMSAIDNVFSRFRLKNFPHGQDFSSRIPAAAHSLMIKVDGDLIKLSYPEITHVQSWGNYVKIYTDSKEYLSAMTTAEIELKLDRKFFRRVHKSFIVALNKVARIKGGQAELDNGKIIPVGTTYRRELIESLYKGIKDE